MERCENTYEKACRELSRKISGAKPPNARRKAFCRCPYCQWRTAGRDACCLPRCFRELEVTGKW